MLRKLSSLTDGLLHTLWQRAEMPSGCALVAVGGYGRAQLFPFSDVDVLLLLPEGTQLDTDSALSRRIEGFIGSCWDAGWKSVFQCAPPQNAWPSAADDGSNLAARSTSFICGNAAPFAHFQGQYQAQMDPGLPVAKTLEMRQRHTKYDNTPYALEPNCKGVTRRLARPATHPVGCQGCRIGRQLERTGRQWHGHPV